VNGVDLLESGIIPTVFSTTGDKTIQLSGGAHKCACVHICGSVYSWYNGGVNDNQDLFDYFLSWFKNVTYSMYNSTYRTL